ncbi:glycosyltransferase [Legionella brunensis]|uniref:Glycosyl transferase family protein n=1 Tax=Legionella brunensis TaxID=29422 RepID=A0A0W0SNV5_9GAMM|nr:glycosyltransferase [Legionella brunensis]KTC84980.1 glycosyl transferase family protein [Legionella brunensis]
MSEQEPERKKRLLTVKQKFILTCFLGVSWLVVVTLINVPWIIQLSNHIALVFAAIAITIIAIIPSFWYAFTLVGFLIDTRPEPNKFKESEYPGVSILVAAYNEEDCIVDTVFSLTKQEYPGEIEIIIIDDGSTDNTMALLNGIRLPNLVVLEVPHQGKAAALNAGLNRAKNNLLVTIDADTYLLPDAIKCIVAHLMSSLPDTAAVAGSVCVRNSRTNILTKVQEWNYFNEFISQKRIQSLFQATLVAQGAFSVYRKDIVVEAGGWPTSVGEDIVLTWAILKKGYRTGFCEAAFSFTFVPASYKKLFLQRSRWSQGMLEALSAHPELLFRKKFSTLFIWWNLLIPIVDLGYGFIFMPGVVAAFFGYYFIAGPMTVSVIPLILLNNFVFFWRNRKEFLKRKLSVRRNMLGYIIFLFLYQPFIMVPAAIHGYFSFFLGRKKWGTKKE